MTKLSFIVIAALAGAGCYNPAIAPCQLACANGTCPDGLACNMQNACAATSTSMCDELPIDAPALDATTNGVTIEVRDRTDGPVAAALVVFADRTGALVAEMPTGADGRASVPMLEFGSATVIRSITTPTGGTQLTATTYLDLWPGAHIINKLEFDQRLRPVTISYNPPSGGAFVVHATCTTAVSTQARNTILMIPERCPTFDVIVTSAPSSTSTPTLAASLTGQTSTNITIPDTQWMPYRNVPGMLTGVPPAATGRIYSAGGWVSPTLPPTARSFMDVQVAAGAPAITFSLPTGIGIASQFVLEYQPTPGIPASRVLIFDRFPATAANVNRDYTGAMLPWIGDPMFSVGTRTLAWPQYVPAGTTVSPASFFAASAQYTRDANTTVLWRVIGSAARIGPMNNLQGVVFPDVPGTRVFEPLPPDIVMKGSVTLFQVEAAAEHDMIQILDPAGVDLDYFKIPTLRHLSVSVPP